MIIQPLHHLMEDCHARQDAGHQKQDVTRAYMHQTAMAFYLTTDIQAVTKLGKGQ